MLDKDHYDQAATVFSPDGRVYQVEYAREAIRRGGLALGITFDNGILFAIDKSIYSPLIEEDDLEKFYKITPIIGAAASGLIADARVLVDILRDRAQSEKRRYGEDPDLRTLVTWVSRIYEVYTRYEGVRPFGTALIIGGRTGKRYRLFETDPSGVFQQRSSTAIGRGSETALEILTANNGKVRTREDSIALSMNVLKSTRQEGAEGSNLGMELHILTDGNFEKIDLTEEQVAEHVSGNEGDGSLEGLLCGVPRLTKEAKNNLLATYGDLSSLKKSSIRDLMKVKGVGKATAERIRKALEEL